VIYGVTPAIVTASRGDVPVLDMIVYRSAVAALVFAVLDRVLRSPRAGPRRDVGSGSHRGILLGVALWGPQVLLFYASFAYIDTSLAVAISFVYPSVVLLAGPLVGRRRPSPLDLTLSLLALIGIAALLLPGGAGGVQAAGVCLALLAAVGYAAYVLGADRLLRGVRPFELGAQISFGALLGTAGVGLALQRLSVLGDPRDWLLVGTNAVMMVAATSCYYGGLTRLGSGQASLLDSLQPVVALAAGSMLLGESMVVTQVLGVALVVASVAVASVVAHRNDDARR
jgi:probable blue pigment (indigoidine) exporter